MTLLTSKILQQLKTKFGLRMTWNLGVVRLVFRIEDGRWELHRRVPYDYDAEFQDLYMKVCDKLLIDVVSYFYRKSENYIFVCSRYCLSFFFPAPISSFSN